MRPRSQQAQGHAAIDFVVLDQQHATRLNAQERRRTLGLQRLRGRESAELMQDLVEQLGRDDRFGHEATDAVFLAEVHINRG